jgi:hypothetical protein
MNEWGTGMHRDEVSYNLILQIRGGHNMNYKNWLHLLYVPNHKLHSSINPAASLFEHIFQQKCLNLERLTTW